MRKYILLLAVSFSFILNLSSKSIENKTGLTTIGISEENYNTNYSDNQCSASYRWIGDNWCNINVRVDNPCNQTAYFYIALKNCSGPDCVRCYWVNAGNFITQPINWCGGATFHWGSCPF